MPTLADIALRKNIRRNLRLDRRIAILGDNNSPSRVRVPGRSAYVYVRYPASGSNTSSLGWPTIVKMIVNLTEASGTPVMVGIDDEGDFAVLTLSTRSLEAVGSPAGGAVINNPLNDWVDLNQSPYLRSQPMGAGAPLVVSVLPYRYMDSDRLLHVVSISGGVDLTSFIPSTANQWLLAGLFAKTDDTIEVAVSTSQDFTEPLTDEDIQETITASSALSIPICMWILRHGQTRIADTDKFVDIRQWINIPQDSGSSTPVTIQAEILLGNDTLGSAAASIDIDLTTDARYSSCVDLKIRGLFRVSVTGTSGFGYVSLRPNGASNNTGILTQRAYADNTTFAADQFTFVAEVSSGDSPSGSFSFVEITIPDFNNSSLLKVANVDITTRHASGTGGNKLRREMYAIDLGITAAITDLQFIATDSTGANSGTLATGSAVRISSTYEVDV